MNMRNTYLAFLLAAMSPCNMGYSMYPLLFPSPLRDAVLKDDIQEVEKLVAAKSCTASEAEDALLGASFYGQYKVVAWFLSEKNRYIADYSPEMLAGAFSDCNKIYERMRGFSDVSCLDSRLGTELNAYNEMLMFWLSQSPRALDLPSFLISNAMQSAASTQNWQLVAFLASKRNKQLSAIEEKCPKLMAELKKDARFTEDGQFKG